MRFQDCKFKNVFILAFLILYNISNAQTNVNNEKYKEERRKEVRASNDSFYLNRDTLYLMYDVNDSLQFLMQGIRNSKVIEWYRKPLTEEEKQIIEDAQSDDIFMDHKMQFYLFKERSFKKKLNKQQLSSLNPASRKEFMEFYEREKIRVNNEFKLTKDRRILIPLINIPLNNYFNQVYMIIDNNDGTYTFYQKYK